MKINFKQLDKSRVCFEIEVPAEEVVKERGKIYDYLKNHAKVPGFRPGKTPQEVLKKQFDDTVRKEVIEHLLPKYFQIALKEKNITPLTLPEFSDIKLEGDSPLSFKATVETRPDIELGQYKKIKLEKMESQITQQDIENKLKELQLQAAALTEVKDRDEVITGDFVIVDFKGLLNGKLMKGWSRQNYFLAASDGEARGDMILNALGRGVVGMKKGAVKTIEVEFPKENSGGFAGKKVLFEVTLKGIRKRILPEIDDEFAGIFGFKNISELKDKIREELEKAWEEREKRRLIDEMVDKIVWKTNIELSSHLIERQRDYLLYKLNNELAGRNVTKEQYLQANNLTEDVLRQQYTQAAARQLKAKLIFSEISKRENIKVEEKDLRSEIENIAASAKKKPEEVKAYLEKRDIIDNLREDILERKVVDFLFSEAKIREKGKVWAGIKKIFGKK